MEEYRLDLVSQLNSTEMLAVHLLVRFDVARDNWCGYLKVIT